MDVMRNGQIMYLPVIISKSEGFQTNYRYAMTKQNEVKDDNYVLG